MSILILEKLEATALKGKIETWCQLIQIMICIAKGLTDAALAHSQRSQARTILFEQITVDLSVLPRITNGSQFF